MMSSLDSKLVPEISATMINSRMLTFIIQLLDWSIYGQPHLFVLFFVWVWCIWMSRAIPALLYRPCTRPYATTTTVIIPWWTSQRTSFARSWRGSPPSTPTRCWW